MVRAKFISLSRIWYTLIVVLIHLILTYFGIKYCYWNDQQSWPKSSSFSSPKFELLIQKICVLSSLVLLFIFIYPALFRIGNLANDGQTLASVDLRAKTGRTSLCTSLWRHCFALSSTLHLMMSFLLLISTVLIDAKQIMVGLRASASLWRTDFDLLFDWSASSSPVISSIKRATLTNTTAVAHAFSVDAYTRLSLGNFLFASVICIVREPYVFWSVSKIFSLIYSVALALNVIQWCLMYAAFQLLLKNICFNTLESTLNIGYLLLHQPYTTFFLYLLLEFLVFISSITFYYYGYNRLQCSARFAGHSSCYERCSHYCPSLIAIVLLLLYTSCKMPLVHDIFLLYLQTHLQTLFLAFVFEIAHVLLILALWIYLTTKVNWHVGTAHFSPLVEHGLTVKNTPIQPTAISLPDLNGHCPAVEKTARRLSDNLYQKPYEKIRIFQSEIYYRNRPKNWSLPLNQHPTVLAAFEHDDADSNDIVIRSTSYPSNELQYRDAIRKTVSNLYKPPSGGEKEEKPAPPAKRFSQEQVEAARVRAQQMILQRQRASDFVHEQRAGTLLISQV